MCGRKRVDLDALTPEELEEFINRRRRQILVHSCIYYRFDQNIISDNTFDMWCHQLIEAQTKFPKVAEKCVYHDDFKKLTHASGFDLPFGNPEIVAKAQYLLRLDQEKRGVKK